MAFINFYEKIMLLFYTKKKYIQISVKNILHRHFNVFVFFFYHYKDKSHKMTVDYNNQVKEIGGKISC